MLVYLQVILGFFSVICLAASIAFIKDFFEDFFDFLVV